MPITLPAHPVAVLPLLRRCPKLPPCALVVGSCVPDLHYVLQMGRVDAHSLPGLFTFNLPVGLVALLWLEVLILPVLRRTLPSLGGFEPARFLRTEGLPRSVSGWAWAVLALLIGAATHLFLDGLTHVSMWPASMFYPDVYVQLGTRTRLLAYVLQYVLSIVGSLVVLGAMVRAYPRLPPAPAARWKDALPLLLAMLIGGMWMLGLRLQHLPPVRSRYFMLWYLFWPTASGALAGLTLACAWLRARFEPERSRF